MFFQSAKETDPLLPKYDQAPEILGSSKQQQQAQFHSYEYPNDEQIPAGWHSSWTRGPPELQDDGHRDDSDDEDNVETSTGNAQTHAMRTVFAFITIAIFFALVVALLNPDRHEPYNPPVWQPPHTPSHNTSRTIEERVHDILSSTPLIDGHNDLAIFIRGQYKNNITSPTFKDEWENGTMPLNVDLPRLRAGQAGGAFWSAFVACPANASYDMTDANYATAVSHTSEQIDLLNRLMAQYPRNFTPATSPSSHSGREIMLSAWQLRDDKPFFGPISIEGLHQVPPTAPMSTLRHYYRLGVRMATLTWNCHNPFADASLVWNDFTTPPSVVNGVFRPDEGAVTRRGRDVIREMNRLGMIVDVSHTSYWTQKAVLEGVSRSPIVFSHSSAYALCPHPRNVRDEILDLVQRSGSLVMVNFSPDFVSCVASDDTNSVAGDTPHFSLPEFYEKNNTLHQVARHITYIGDRVGYDHVGLGSDFDGMGRKTPRGLEGVDRFPDLVAELLKMGVSDEDAKKVVGGNLLRVWQEADAVSDRMKSEGVVPGLDDADGY